MGNGGVVMATNQCWVCALSWSNHHMSHSGRGFNVFGEVRSYIFRTGGGYTGEKVNFLCRWTTFELVEEVFTKP
jgi:hypothetical protein